MLILTCETQSGKQRPALHRMVTRLGSWSESKLLLFALEVLLIMCCINLQSLSPCVKHHACLQVMAEVQGFLKLLGEVYGVFGLDYSMALSTRPESYLVRGCWVVGRLGGRSVRWSVGWLVGWLFDQLVV